MKKLLSLLSVLTISGTAIPTTIAASNYQKEKKLKNIADDEEFNTNNLEKLNRVKRGNKKDNKPKNNNKPELTNENSVPSTSNKNKKCNNKGNKKCPIKNEESSLITTKSAKERILNNIKNHSNNIFKHTNNKYKDFLRESINYFQETKNIVHETTNPFTGKYIFKIKKHNVEDSYKKIPLEFEDNKVDLILNKSNLYVDGIITNNDNMDETLWYFKDSTIDKKYPQIDKNKKISEIELKDRCDFFTKIIGYKPTTENDLKNHVKLLNFDSNYNTLKDGEENIKINKKNIKDAIINLSKINETNQQDLKNDFLRVIFTTAESTRFFSVRDEVKKVLSSSDLNQSEINWQDHKDTLTNWDKNSQKYYKMKDSIELQLKMTLEEKQKIYNIAVLAVKDDEKIRDSQRG